ncbi:MAG: hypothetical protein EOP53_09155 [Sphingobacteriales bacterium]|nr:MAG: hypothetical protein EOP53_09155 [Sphingobacteriales bacterium]
MSAQNFKNHIRLVPLQMLGYLAALIALGLAVMKFWRSYSTGVSGLLVPTILLLNTFAIITIKKNTVKIIA